MKFKSKEEVNIVGHRRIRLDAQRLDVAMALEGVKSDKNLMDIADITRPTMIQVRKTGRCSFEVWEKLSSALNVNPIDLIVADGYPDPKLAALVNR